MSNAVTIDIKGRNDNLKDALGGSESMIKGFGSKIMGAFAAIGATIGAVMSVRAVFDWGKSFVEAAAAAQESTAKLDAVMTATGRAAGFTTEQLVGLADQLQSVTKFESETTQEAMAIIATFKNIRGDIFIEATKAAQDMATVMGTDLSGASMQVAKALNDPLKGMTALSRAGVSFTEQQEEMINALIKSGDVMGAQRVILKELQSEFGGAAEKIGGTFSGQMEILKNRFGDISESIGEMLIPWLQELSPMMDGLATVIENLIPVIASWSSMMITGVKSMMQQLQPFFDFMLDAGIAAFTGLQLVIENFVDVGLLAINTWALQTVSNFEMLRHWLTEALPQYLSWFGDNWLKVWFDLQQFQATILTNMGKNIMDFVVAVKDALQGRGFDFKFTSLLEGFQLTMDELPEIAERIPTELEKDLQSKVAALTLKLTGKFAEDFAANKKALLDLFRKGEKDIDLTNTASDEFDPDAFTTKDDTKGKKAKAAKKEKEDKGQQATFEDLDSLNKRIAAAAASTHNDPIKLAVKANELAAENNKLLGELVHTTKDHISLADKTVKATEETAETIETVGTLHR